MFDAFGHEIISRTNHCLLIQMHILGVEFHIFSFLASEKLKPAGFVHSDAFAGDNRALMLAHA